jgi:7,8-dihydropterin-6-yl-methyl-4-(beta-D-ribofuranosyl)aminobenzene 5'-phosphate synthase
MHQSLKSVDRVEILTLQDNYIDLTVHDSNDVIHRAMPLRGLELSNSILAEHGFSALVTVHTGDESRTLLFDFGLSEFGAAYNADATGADLGTIEIMVLSHGHSDHIIGMEALVAKIGKPGLELVAHPAALRRGRYLKVNEQIKVDIRSLAPEKVAEAGVKLVTTDKPYPLLDGHVLFLGEIPRHSGFEKGVPNMFYTDGGAEKWDPIEDDTAIVAHVRDRGLVVLSGCAHSGIVNTVRHARELTGENRLLAVMGGFHLNGPLIEPAVQPTIEALKDMAPRYIVPTHCTGREAVRKIEEAMPDAFILNMAGTKLVFAA